MVSFWFVHLLFGKLVLTNLKWGKHRTILVPEAQTEHNSLYTDEGVSHVYGDTSRNVVSETRAYLFHGLNCLPQFLPGVTTCPHDLLEGLVQQTQSERVFLLYRQWKHLIHSLEEMKKFFCKFRIKTRKLKVQNSRHLI